MVPSVLNVNVVKRDVRSSKSLKVLLIFSFCSITHNTFRSSAQKGGVCIGHGAKVVPKKRCSVEGCGKQAQKGAYCQRHRVMNEKEEKEGVAASGKGSGLKEG